MYLLLQLDNLSIFADWKSQTTSCVPCGNECPHRVKCIRLLLSQEEFTSCLPSPVTHSMTCQIPSAVYINYSPTSGYWLKLVESTKR